MKYLNIAIVAHVDAGKTSLTENLLYQTKTIKKVGKVDNGDTQTDSLNIERRRGITIKASPISFYFNDIKINLIDTPGHADFISEVERSLVVLDGAVLVVSGVEGIQAQTKIILDSLIKLKIPTIIFINKLDRTGADVNKVIQQLKDFIHVINLYNLEILEKNKIKIKKKDWSSLELELVDILSVNNDELISEFMQHGEIKSKMIYEEFKNQVSLCMVSPVIIGSAINGVGIVELLQAISDYIPINKRQNVLLSGLVFKKENSLLAANNKCFFRLFAGCINRGDIVNVISNHGVNSGLLKIKKLSKLERGKLVETDMIACNDIGVIHNSDLNIGDVLGYDTELIKKIKFTQPNMEVSVRSKDPSEENKLFIILKSLSNADPNIHISKDPINNSIKLRIFGEIQKEFIHHTLEEDYNLQVQFGETSIVYIEKPIGEGRHIEKIGDSHNPFIATIGLKVEPSFDRKDFEYEILTEKGALPQAFYNAIEESIKLTLEQGLYGWEVKGIKVTLYEVNYISPISTAADFRNLTPIVLMHALHKAETNIFEPINYFNLYTTSKNLDKIVSFLIKSRAQILYHASKNLNVHLKGTVPVSEINKINKKIKNLAEGEGNFISEPFSFREIINKNELPIKKRSGFNPLDRSEYLLSLTKGLKDKSV
ncbi:elongation factor G [Paenibacillus faecalis]|uniref:elongation factor G n=1 Tax=Paenibacillus faecalis TaxID=2079532 RepID=UPI000D0F5DBA|nr:TetM/TetW/TetO/TetS family tetracycline resistance ribosomal protection protein [Paenibacillus faecalis]